MILTIKKRLKSLMPLKTRPAKGWFYTMLILISLLLYLYQTVFEHSEDELQSENHLLQDYGEQLRNNKNSEFLDTPVVKKEREVLLLAIEQKIGSYLYRIPDYSYLPALEPYLEHSTKLLEQIPSVVPLEKDHFYISSDYGYRIHPISDDLKKHHGIDLAAMKDRPVCATASGTIIKVITSTKGYGTHIIIKHRFGFQTLYGHLNKVLVTKGQTIEQHELIATVGSTGAATGNNLHYEVIKNNLKIDPTPSLGLKRNIYMNLEELQNFKKSAYYEKQ